MKTKITANKLRVKYRRPKKDLYYYTMKKFPEFMKHLVSDLLDLDEYTENEISFGSGISLDDVRGIANGRMDRIDRKNFQKILYFYSRAICGWAAKYYRDFEFD